MQRSHSTGPVNNMSNQDQSHGSGSGSRKKSLSFRKARGFLKSYRRCNSLTSSCHTSQYEESEDKEMRYEHFIRKIHVPAEVQQKISEILLVLRDIQPHYRDQADKINSLLDWCCSRCSIDVVVSFVDPHGYDLLQRIVALGLDQVVAHIIELGFSVQLLNRPCTSPLHLACRKGYIKIVEQFLNHGADLKCKSAVCYPTQHCNGASMNVHNNSYHSNLRWTNQNCCVSQKLSLINIALSSDNVEVLRVLMLHKRSECLDKKMALYNACQRDATKCLAFMAPLLPDQANDRYGYQDNSLFFIAFSKSVNCGMTLLECDLDWKEETILKTNPVGDSLLHLVLRYPAHENIFHLTKLAMDKCFPKTHINKTDLNGNSPLLVLLKVVGRKVSVPLTFTRHSEDIPYESIVDRNQRNWNEQIFDTVRYLVEQGADVKATNKAGETVLHALLKDHHARNLWGMYSSFYKEALPEIIRVMEYMLTLDLDVNIQSEHVSTPLVWVIHILTSLEVYSIETTWPSFSYLFDLLLEHGADPNVLDEKGIHIISIMFTTVNRWINQCVVDLDLGRACRMLRHIITFMHKLFQHGVELSSQIQDLCIKQIMIICNVYIPTEAADQAPQLLFLIGKLLSVFFIHAIDPHKLQLISEKHDFNEVPCKLYARFYLARAFIMHRHHDGMFDFFEVLESSLDQENLNNLIQSICNILSSNFEDNSYRETSRCIEKINEKRKKYRLLQTLCKVIISKQVKWKLKEKTAQLQLPRAMQKYLLFNANNTIY